ncbi:response regulator transcription factor [Tunturiibacter gelidoferens]|jgi:DNA-binding NarL/FixJ family response regulator|uniref:DNA-binding NarL/FixJ family response regulator n=1 Tax=Tunturiibacter gelidiferens TaxID=3069689 RepID=A0A9X0U6D4_9BACT|nr:response regulator transcription factor [Edaphobacter lichenicola]MBB5330955.1 DNA-binding NarL/FixJ family response regulator [Edaphobacter lichenicola]
MKRFTEERNSPGVIKVMAANLPIILCELLQGAFQAVPDIKIVLPANDLQHLLNAAEPLPVDVILIGSSKTDSLGAVSILQSIPDVYKNARVVVLTQDPDYAEVISLFRAGAKGIFGSADLRFELLCKCIRCVHQGQIWAKNELLAHLVSSLSHPRSTNVVDRHGKPLLTTREQQVLHLLSDGLSNSELATVLKLSEHTIKNHLFRIYDKLGVSNRMEAVLYALTPRNPPPVQNRPSNPMPSNKITIIKTA